jgi:pentatricopeptide repeat protein
MLGWGCSDEEGADDVVCPNEFTVAAVVQACGLARDERLTRMVHGYLMAGGFCGDPFVLSSLVNMYAKVGDVASARRLLLGLPCRDVVSWTAIVSGCVLNAMLEEALGVFLMMLEDGVLPNNVTISACSHSGLILEGHKCFESMGRDHDIEPSMEGLGGLQRLSNSSGTCLSVLKLCCVLSKLIFGLNLDPD